MTPAPVLSSTAVVRVFISCPGDLGPERHAVVAALEALNTNIGSSQHVRLVPYAYENLAPARTGMDAQDVVNSYMLRPEDADLFICLFCRRMGTPLQRFINPDTNQPYQSGTEYEYLRAYAAAQHHATPVILLYRCEHPVLPSSAAEGDREQLARVDTFFARFGPGGDLKGMYGTFSDAGDLAEVLQRDVARVLEADLLPLLARRSGPQAGPIIFGLPPLPAGYVERPEALEVLRKALLGSRPAVGVVAATAVHGLGGLGKTVLARAICDDTAVRAAFPDGILWATLGQQPDLARLQREWIRALGGDFIAATSPESGRAELSRLIADRALLLILDDVWQASDAAALEVAGPRCRVLVTTRFASQADGATLVPLEVMRPEEARSVLRSAARGRVTDDVTLSVIGERLGHLPLALQVIGALLALELPWPEIEQALDEGDLPEVTAGQRSLFEALATSVRFLPPDQQQRYRELVIFPADEPLEEAAVARLWARTGSLHTFGARRLLAEFRDRALVQAGNTLHDLQVDYLHAVVPAGERHRLHSVFCDTYGDPAAWSNTLSDDDGGYAWRRLAGHLKEATRETELKTLLTDSTYLQHKLERLGVAAVVSDLGLCPDVADIKVLSLVIQTGAVVLSQKPDELANQVRGRVGTIADVHHWPTAALPSFQVRSTSLLAADPALVRTFVGHADGVWGCAFSPDGRLALSASWDRTLRLWEVESGTTIRTFTGHTREVYGCAFSPDGRLALSASADHSLRLWEIESGATVRTFTGHADGVWGCAFSPDGRLALSASWDRTLRLWEIESGATVRTFVGHTRAVRGCAFSPNGQLALSSSEDRTLRLWEVTAVQSVRTFIGHTREVRDCAFSPDGRLALSASRDGTLRLWDVTSGKSLRVLAGHTRAVYGCAFSPDGQLALSASDSALRLWGVTSGTSLRFFTGHTRPVYDCAFSPDGRLALSASRDGTLRLWDVTSGELVRTFSSHTGRVNGCAFSPDGRLVLSTDETLRLWDVTTGELLRTFSGHTSPVRACAFSPDGQLALSTSLDHTLRLWTVARGKTVHVFKGHTDWVWSCAFSPDGQLALSVSADRTLRLWNVASGQEITHWLTDAALYCCAFGRDGRHVMVGDEIGGVHFLDVVGLTGASHSDESLSLQRSKHVAGVSAANTTAPTADEAVSKPLKRKGWWPFGRR